MFYNGEYVQCEYATKTTGLTGSGYLCFSVLSQCMTLPISFFCCVLFVICWYGEMKLVCVRYRTADVGRVQGPCVVASQAAEAFSINCCY